MIDFLFSWLFDILFYWLLFFVLTLILLSNLVSDIKPVNLPPVPAPTRPEHNFHESKDDFLSWIKYLFLKTGEILYKISGFLLNAVVKAFSISRIYWYVSIFLGFVGSFIVYFIF